MVFPRPGIELVRDCIALPLGQDCLAFALTQALADQPIGVLAGAEPSHVRP